MSIHVTQAVNRIVNEKSSLEKKQGELRHLMQHQDPGSDNLPYMAEEDRLLTHFLDELSAIEGLLLKHRE